MKLKEKSGEGQNNIEGSEKQQRKSSKNTMFLTGESNTLAMELVLLLSTCDPFSSLVGSSGSMRPISVTHVLKGLGAAENGAT